MSQQPKTIISKEQGQGAKFIPPKVQKVKDDNGSTVALCFLAPRRGSFLDKLHQIKKQIQDQDTKLIIIEGKLGFRN